MNKNVFLISIVLVSCLLTAGCNKSGKLNEESKFKTPTGPVEFKLKWPAGERIIQSIDMKMDMEISVPNQTNTIQQAMTMREEYGLTVLKANADGGHELEMEFLSMRMKLDQGGKTLIDYDSANKPSEKRKSAAIATVEEMFQNIIGAKIQFFLDASNQVERIEGVDALMSRLETGGRANGLSGIKSMFNEGTLKQMISSEYLPPKPVQPGDTWTNQSSVTMGELGTMAMNYNFSFERWEMRGKRNCARVEFQGTMSSKGSPSSTGTGMTMSIQDGTSSGVSWFDPELGLVIESLVNQDLKMNMTMPVRVRGKTINQTMTSLMKQAITIKLESVK